MRFDLLTLSLAVASAAVAVIFRSEIPLRGVPILPQSVQIGGLATAILLLAVGLHLRRAWPTLGAFTALALSMTISLGSQGRTAAFVCAMIGLAALESALLHLDPRRASVARPKLLAGPFILAVAAAGALVFAGTLSAFMAPAWLERSLELESVYAPIVLLAAISILTLLALAMFPTRRAQEKVTS